MDHKIITLLASVALFNPGNAVAQDYPVRPIRLVVPFPAGGNTDIMARMLALQVGPQFGESMVIDNRAGADGIIGAQIVASAVPDGYTLLHNSAALVINQNIYRKLPYDLKRDLTPITTYAQGVGYLLLVSASSPAQTINELVALAKSREKPMSYGSAGIGNTTHLLAALFTLNAKIDPVHVPYKGLAPAMTALMGGEVQFAFSAPPAALPFLKSGKMRVLAFTGQSRWPSLPEVPTIAESGIPHFDIGGGWFAWFVQARTPPAIIAKLHSQIVRALKAPEFVSYLRSGGYEPDGRSPEEARKFVHAEIDRYGEAVKAAKIPMQ